jgi:hypothetical protein
MKRKSFLKAAVTLVSASMLPAIIPKVNATDWKVRKSWNKDNIPVNKVVARNDPQQTLIFIEAPLYPDSIYPCYCIKGERDIIESAVLPCLWIYDDPIIGLFEDEFLDMLNKDEYGFRNATLEDLKVLI